MTQLVNPVTGVTITLKDGDDERAYRLQGWHAPIPVPNSDSNDQPPTHVVVDEVREEPSALDQNQEG